MTRQFSAAARDRMLEPWEEFVGYVYDDKRGKVHGKYPEWDGGAVRGTLTIGWGHTAAAAGRQEITKGAHITREQADALLTDDLAPCVAAVNRLVKVKVTQHQFDALVDTYFNCPSAAVAAIKLINAGRIDQVPAKLLQYVNSKGERMQGLVRRRNAEIAWFHTPDDIEAPPAPNPDIVHSPKAERNPPPKPAVQSKTIVAGGAVLSATIAQMAKAINEMLDPIKEAKGSLDDLGLAHALSLMLHNPVVLLGGIIAAAAVFIIADRHWKLTNDGV